MHVLGYIVVFTFGAFVGIMCIALCMAAKRNDIKLQPDAEDKDQRIDITLCPQCKETTRLLNEIDEYVTENVHGHISQ